MKKRKAIIIGSVIAIMLCVIVYVVMIKKEIIGSNEVQQEIKRYIEEPSLGISLYEESLTKSGATFSVGSMYSSNGEKNTTKWYNHNYRIDKKKDGKWEKLPLKLGAKKLDYGENYVYGDEWTDWSDRYGVLKTGEYRYVKQIENGGEKIEIAYEFTITDNTPKDRSNRQYAKQEKITYTLKEGTLTREGAIFLRTVFPPEGHTPIQIEDPMLKEIFSNGFYSADANRKIFYRIQKERSLDRISTY